MTTAPSAEDIRSQSGSRVGGGWEAIYRISGLILLAVLLVMRIESACRYRFNTDETQHLHVLWNLTRGLIEYRDFFDNHPPLFHMVMAPIFHLFPERADIVVPMRLLMIPFFIASLAAVYRIGRALYSAGAGIWLALIAGGMPAFFFPGSEFRPDDLYAALWLWTLVVAIESRFNLVRAGIMGLLVGICIGITVKTALPVMSLGMAGAVAFALRFWLSRWRPSVTELLVRGVVSGLAGIIIPALLCAYFYAHHALPRFIYCVLKHNVVPHGERWGGSMLNYLYLPLGLPFILPYAHWIYKAAPNPELATRRVILALIPLFYYLLMYSYWPEISDHDNLPGLPLVPLAVMPIIDWASRRFRLPIIGYVVLPAAAVTFLMMIWHAHVIQRASVAKYVDRIAIVLKLTRPGEYVMDLKGDSIYRPRPTYYTIEAFARIRMRLGWIKDDIAERLIATRTPLCFHPPYPEAKSMKFINANYLPLAGHANIIVLGQELPKPARATIPFTISIPASYVLLQDARPAVGTLDGHPYQGAEIIAAGNHQFAPTKPTVPVILYWARAWEDGFPPGPRITAVNPKDL